MSVPSIEKLTALEPWTVVGVRAGDLLDCLASASDAVAAVQGELVEARRERDDAGLRWGEHYNGAMGALESRLEAVRALHPASADAPAHCLEDGEAWPCDTLRAAGAR